MLTQSPLPSNHFLTLKPDLSIQTISGNSRSAFASTVASTRRNASKLVIEDETDFIHKVRNKFLVHRNNQAALKI